MEARSIDSVTEGMKAAARECLSLAVGCDCSSCISRIGQAIAKHVGPELAALTERLRVAEERLAREESAHEVTIQQRDVAEDCADTLAHKIANLYGFENEAAEVIGEHSNLNCPWRRAIDLTNELPSRSQLAAAQQENAEACRLISEAFPAMDKFVNLVPSVRWLIGHDADILKLADRIKKERAAALATKGKALTPEQLQQVLQYRNAAQTKGAG